MPIEATNSLPGAVPAPGAVPGAASSGGLNLNLWGKDGFTFTDLLDFINPLQHIPVVSSIYRSITGDEMGNAARIIGGAALGGVGGVISSLIDATVEISTGKDIGAHVIAFFKDMDVHDTAPATASQLAQEFGLGDTDNVDTDSAPETLLVAANDTTFDQDIAAARAAVPAADVAQLKPAVKQPRAPDRAAMASPASPASAKIPVQISAQIPAQNPVLNTPGPKSGRAALPRGQAGSATPAAPSPMAGPNMSASSIAQAAFAGGSSLPAGSAFYAAQPANALAALMATAKANPQAPVAQNMPFAQNPFTQTMDLKTMVDQTGGQPFWLGLMAENADKAKSQNLLPPKAAKATGATLAAQFGQQGKTLAQYRAAARLGVTAAPGKQIYR